MAPGATATTEATTPHCCTAPPHTIPAATTAPPAYYYAPEDAAAATDYSLSAYYTPGATASTPAVTEPTAVPASLPGPVTVDVHVPASAQVWFDGVPTQATGDWRRFQSPPLVVGTNYQYDVRARWTESGRVVDQTRHITVHAFEVTLVDFTEPTPAVAAR